MKKYEVYHILKKGFKPEDLQKAYDLGLFKKEELIDGKEYVGRCRNAEKAVWHAAKQRFTYIRNKWGYEYEEDIVHPVDDEGYDIFVCVKEDN